MSTKTHYKKLRNPNYIGSYELMKGDENIELVVRITGVSQEGVQNGDKKEQLMVATLEGQNHSL